MCPLEREVSAVSGGAPPPVVVIDIFPGACYFLRGSTEPTQPPLGLPCLPAPPPHPTSTPKRFGLGRYPEGAQSAPGRPTRAQGAPPPGWRRRGLGSVSLIYINLHSARVIYMEMRQPSSAPLKSGEAHASPLPQPWAD